MLPSGYGKNYLDHTILSRSTHGCSISLRELLETAANLAKVSKLHFKPKEA
jgi:hypothetical protein